MTSPKSSRPLCSVPGCAGVVDSRGWCAMHYQRWRATGDVQVDRLKERHRLSFDERTDKSGGDDACWLWLGKRAKGGYGRVQRGGREVKAHRIAYEIAYGLIPEGVLVCHSCDTPLCVNPSHLFLGTNADNTRDMMQKGRHHEASKTHCKRGHPFTEDNIYRQPRRPNKRACKTCIRIRGGVLL